jgi:hypothetical protein
LEEFLLFFIVVGQILSFRYLTIKLYLDRIVRVYLFFIG